MSGSITVKRRKSGTSMHLKGGAARDFMKSLGVKFPDDAQEKASKDAQK